MEKRKRGFRRTTQLKEKERRRATTAFEKQMRTEGIIKLPLSYSTQKAIGCVIGEDIVSELPWIFVEKEKIEDNLELHEFSSEFLPIRDAIMRYPEPQILMGHYKEFHVEEDVFLICTTLDAKLDVLKYIEDEKYEMVQKFLHSLDIIPRKWFSFGLYTFSFHCDVTFSF